MTSSSNSKQPQPPMCIQLALFLPAALGRVILLGAAIVCGLAIPESLQLYTSKGMDANFPHYATMTALLISIVAMVVFLLVDGATKVRTKSMAPSGVTAGMGWVLVLLLLQLATGASLLVWWSGSHASLLGLPQDINPQETTWMLLSTVGASVFAAVLLTLEALLHVCCAKYTDANHNNHNMIQKGSRSNSNNRTYDDDEDDDDDDLEGHGGYDDPTVDDNFLDKYTKSVACEASTIHCDDGHSKQPRYATEAWANPY